MRTASLVATSSVFAFVALVVACSSDPTPTLVSNKDSGTSGEVDARRPYPSFRDDVVPIVQTSCALTACHSSKESNLGIYLTFDAAQIYAELQKPSPTAKGEKFIVSGDPAKSYVLAKLEGRQGTATCTGTCGTEMPPGDKLTATQIAVWRKWITEGAKNN